MVPYDSLSALPWQINPFKRTSIDYSRHFPIQRLQNSIFNHRQDVPFQGLTPRSSNDNDIEFATGLRRRRSMR
jgi:hypothetical protein